MWFITVSNCFHKTRHWSHWTHHSPISLCFLHTHFLTGYLWHAQSLRCQKEDGWIHRGWMDGSVNRWLISLVLIAASVVEKSSWCCLTIKCPDVELWVTLDVHTAQEAKLFIRKTPWPWVWKTKTYKHTHTHTHTRTHTHTCTHILQLFVLRPRSLPFSPSYCCDKASVIINVWNQPRLS